MDFEEASQFVRAVEANALEYVMPEEEKAPAKRRIEFSPPEFSEMGYQEALALNGRVEKVITGAEMLMKLYGAEAKAAPPAPAAKKPEGKKVSAVMEAMVPMKKEAEMPAAPREAPKPPKMEALAPVVEAVPEIEFEEKKGEEGALEFEEEKGKRAKVEERWAGEARRREAPAAPPAAKPTMRPSAAPEIAIRVPPILMGSPADSAAETIERIEKQFGSEVKVGKKVDKEEVKRRMLELTRELFREKSNERREEIKKEIVALKTILSETEGGGKAKPKADILSVVRNDQEYELSSAKKAVGEAYVNALAPLLKYFDEEAALGRAAEALPAFESRASQLKEQVAGLAAGYEKYLVGKHSEEFVRLAEKGKLEGAAGMADKIADTYSAEFFELRKSIASEIDAEAGKRKAEVGGNAGRGETEEDLLAYLQEEAPLVYGKYSRGEMARADAFAEARRLKARKGINKGTAEG
ncbi:MAG: hypothetical protein WC350_04035 [Candidatus Micrarchaeia archaeon]|jgi:hypothetical protein